MKKFLFTLATVTTSLIATATVQPKEDLNVACCNEPIIIDKENPTAEISMDIFGVWQSLDNEFVQISRDMDYQITFMRVASSKQLQAKGFITAGDESVLSIDRIYPETESYNLQYVFSPSRKTLVIMKPNSDQAWVFHKVQ